MQRFKFIDFMVIELRFFKKKKKMENMDKMWNHFFRYYVHLTSQRNQFFYTGYFSHILHLGIIKSEINFKSKVKTKYMIFNGDRP